MNGPQHTGRRHVISFPYTIHVYIRRPTSAPQWINPCTIDEEEHASNLLYILTLHTLEYHILLLVFESDFYAYVSVCWVCFTSLSFSHPTIGDHVHARIHSQTFRTPTDHSPIRAAQLKAWPKMVGSNSVGTDLNRLGPATTTTTKNILALTVRTVFGVRARPLSVDTC